MKNNNPEVSPATLELKGISNFDVLKKMATEDKSIMLCPDVLNMNYSAKKGGTRIEVGVPGNPIAGIFSGKKRAVLLIWDVAEFDEAKSQLEAVHEPK